MFTTETVIKTTDAGEYIRHFHDRERFIGYCRSCENYGTVWVCPPYGFDCMDMLRGLDWVHIVGTRTLLDEKVRHSPQNAAHQKELSYEVMARARRDIDWRLLELEKRYPGSRAFFAGSCFLCRKEDCTRRTGKPCIRPESARSSIEAYGFDVARTASQLLGIEMKWSDKLVLPEYFTLVSALFSTEREIEWP